MISGSCACRYIRYTANVAPAGVVNCHCTTCRKQAGAPYQAFVHFPISSFKWEVEPTKWQSSEIAFRTFCPHCGSNLSMSYDSDPNEIAIVAGTLDDGTIVPPPSKHIFLKDKAPWYELPEDGAARYQGWTG
ncbi:hypothetical protein N7520_009012 [Penicillium odoratum]|uniref:uncharacterized protein n=1 Tax=Penicillium odoratum TaxID=1167516 RepID=UPI00254890F2|nr:uncharacterized protein N7520_009012 [Penicillium odoratum]KAJ5752095.1 hypothetical protein N7520_009012 [Penicillium odoratum]